GIPFIGRLSQWVRDSLPFSADQVQAWITNGVQTLLKSAAAASGAVSLGVVGKVVSFFIMLFLLFFFLRDGNLLLSHGMRLIPMRPAQRNSLTGYLSDVTHAVVFGHVLTALVQGAFVGIGFAIVGLPSPLVFAVFATVAAFVPGGGTALI